jgi:hypothetical protein
MEDRMRWEGRLFGDRRVWRGRGVPRTCLQICVRFGSGLSGTPELSIDLEPLSGNPFGGVK